MTLSHDRSDEELVDAFIEGDNKAFSTIVERHRTRLTTVARRYTRNDHDAQDVVQEAFLRALAARNAVTLAELEEEKQRDNTLTGATEFLGASHAFPTPETKRSAFDKALTPGAYSNAEVDALVAGFNAPRSASLQEAFAEEFFSRVEDIWAAHPIEIANRLIRGFYPELPMADAATTRLLHRELPGALRLSLIHI